jgi:hypothetical protein
MPQQEIALCWGREVSMIQENADNPDEPPLPDVAWDIRREGRRWSGDEAMARFALTPEKFEMYEGRLFGSEAERVILLGLLLENIGADRAVRLGNPDVWRHAIRELG